MPSRIVSDLSWYQKSHNMYLKNVQAKLSAVRSKLFLHENENNTYEAEQALPAWRGAGRSSRGTKPLLSNSDGARSCRIRLRRLLCIAEKIQNEIINRKTELCHHRPQRKAHSNEYDNNTHKAEQPLPAWCGAGESSRSTRPRLSSSDGARSCRNRPRCLPLYSSKKQKTNKQKQPTPGISVLL